MKTVYWGIFLTTCLSCLSCSEEGPLDNGNDVSLFFSTNRAVTGKQVEEIPPSVLIFRRSDSANFSFIPDDGNSDWQSSDTEFTRNMNLPVGKYRFMFARGFSFEPTDGRCAFTWEKGASGNYDKDYFFAYPSSGVENGERVLKPCPTELYADTKEEGSELNDTEYSLGEGNHLSVSRKMTRLQGRIDLLLRRGIRVGKDTYEVLPEGPDNENALTNALKKIKAIQVTVANSSSRCHVAGLSFDSPGRYSFGLSPADFTVFSSKIFMEELKGAKPSDYLVFDNSAYYKGPLLFPAPGDESAEINLVVEYISPLAPRKTTKPVKMERNKVAFVIIWLINEEVGVDVNVDITVKDLEFWNDEAKGDDGFWN